MLKALSTHRAAPEREWTRWWGVRLRGLTTYYLLEADTRLPSQIELQCVLLWPKKEYKITTPHNNNTPRSERTLYIGAPAHPP